MKPRDERLDMLIAEGVFYTQAIENAKQTLDKIHGELDAYFAGKGGLEHIATEFGTAMRIVDERVMIDPPCLVDVTTHLGSQFPRFFETKTICTARERYREILSGSDTLLARQLKRFLVIPRTRHFVFTPGKAKAVIDVP